MHRTRLLIAPALAFVLVAAGCGGDDDGAAADTEAAAPATTEASAPVNPEGSFLLLRWSTGSDNPVENEALGLATARYWGLDPTCDGDEPCDLTLSGGGEDGSYFLPEFDPGDGFPDSTLAWDDDAEAWVLDEELGPYGNCRTADGAYLDGDYTTMDEVDHTELAWDDSGTRLVGTKTETYTLNDAGQANPECTADSDEVVSYSIVAVPADQYGEPADEPVELADSYFQSREVYAVEGNDNIAVNDWRVNLEETAGEGSCGTDECDAQLTVPFTDEHDLVLDLEDDDGALRATSSMVNSCSSDSSLASGEPEVLTDEGYQADADLEVVPVTLDDEGHQALVAHGDYTATPLPDAAAEFPDDCATTEVTSAYYYLIPSDLVS